MRVLHYGPSHPICHGELDGDAEEFAERWLPTQVADGVFLVKAGSVVIGWLRYYWQPDTIMLASGTWVDSEYRGKGIAHALWARAMRTLRPKRVIITTVSPEGRRLVGSIVQWFPKVEFDVR